MPNEFKIEGLEELREKLEGLGAIAGQKVVASAARAAMQPVLDEAVRLVPKKTGLLAKTLRLTATKPKSGDIVASAGIAMRAKVKDEIPVEEGFQGPALDVKVKGAGWRWHFVEFGVPSRGIPAHPFLRPAMSTKVTQVVEIFRAALEKKVLAAIRKQGKAKAGG